MTRNIKNSIVLFIGIFLLLSCDKKEKHYYYAFYTEANSSRHDSYIIKKVINTDSRKELDFMFSEEGKLKSKSGNIFKVTSVGLEKKTQQKDVENYKPYLVINRDDFINFEYADASLNDFASTSFKYKGKKDIIVDGVKYIEAYNFIKKQGDVNTITSSVFYDKNFILIKEEFLEGERQYYRIERIDTVLDFSIKRVGEK